MKDTPMSTMLLGPKDVVKAPRSSTVGGPRPLPSTPPESALLRGNYRQQHMGRAIRVVEDRVVGQVPAAVVVERLPGIRVHVEAREIAARDVEPDAVAPLEDEGSGIELDRERVHL